MGSVSFDAADRLAIINLFGAFSDTYDNARWDEFRALFVDGAEIRWYAGDRIVFEGLDIAISSVQARLEKFKNQKNQRRHNFTSFQISAQSATEATGRCYTSVFNTTDGGPPAIELTGNFEFTAVKRDGAWRIRRLVAHMDQAHL
jgi:hypothetical protein